MGKKNKNGHNTNIIKKILSGFTWRILSIPIFLKIMGIGFLVAIFFGSVTLFQTRIGTARVLTRLLEQQILTVTSILAETIEEPASSGDAPEILRHFEKIRDIYPEMRYAVVRYPDGRVMASTLGDSTPQKILDITAMNNLPAHNTRIIDSDEGTIYEAQAPILGGKAGFIQVGFADTAISRNLEIFTWTILWGLLICIVVGAGLAFLLTIILTRPLHYLVESANRIREGNFNTRADIFSNDEIGRLAVAFNQMTEALNRYRQEVQAKEKDRLSLIERIVQVQEDERKSISRELHDHLGQSLLAILLQVQSIRKQKTLSDSVLQNVEQSIRQATDEIHRLAWGMRPSILDDYGLDSALARHIEEISRHVELEVDYSFSNPPGLERLPGRIEVCLFRIAQEALTNIQRHAEASHASVVVLRQLHDITMLIEDNGKGFHPSILEEKRDKCLGLIGMKERIALLGGVVTIESIPGEGTTIRARIPLSGDENAYTNLDS